MSLTPAQPTVTTPPVGAKTTPQPGYTPVVVQPPPKTVETGQGRGSSTTTVAQPSYTVYVPPPEVKAQLLTFKGPSGQSTFTVDPNILKNPTPVEWGGGTIGVMFDNPDTGQRNFAGFGDYTQQWANSNGRIESIMPGSPLGRYANDSNYSGWTIKATTNKPQSGNAPAWTLPQGYQVGGYSVFADNPFAPTNTDTFVRETSKGNSSALGSIAEVVQDVVKTFPEWAPVVAFPLAVAVGAAGGVAPLFSSGSTAGLTGAGAGSAAGIAGGGLSSASTGALTTGLTGSTVTTGLTGAAVGTGAAVPTSAAGSLGGALTGAAGSVPLNTTSGGLGGGSGPVGTTPAPGSGGLGGVGGAPAGGEVGPYLAPLDAESVVGPYLAPLDAASKAAAPIAKTTGGALGGILDKLKAGDVVGALGSAGSGVVDWALANPKEALSVVGGVADLFKDSPTYDYTGGAGTGTAGAGSVGKSLPVAPPLNRTLKAYPGDLRYYATPRAQPGPGSFDYFGTGEQAAPVTPAVQAPLVAAAPAEAQAVKRNQAVLDALGHAHGGPIGGGVLEALPSRYFGGGPGGGQDDLIDAKVSPGEFVFDSSTVSDLGDGNNDEGARRLQHMVEQIRRQKRGGRRGLPPKAAAPLDYLRRGA